MNLIKAELSRLVSRRFVQVLTILLFAVFGITVAVTLASSHQPTAAEWQQAQQSAERQREESARWQSECLAAHQPGTPESVARNFPDDIRHCRVDLAQIKPEDFLYDAFVFRQYVYLLIGFLAAYLALFGFLIGATFVGAELASGGVTNLLLWRPQRLRVLGAKLGVLLGVVGAFSTVFTLIYVGTFWTLGHTNGYPGRLEEGFWGDLTMVCVRGITLALVATALSFGVATIGRHTAAALGLLTAYTVVWEGGGRLIMDVLRAPLIDPWFLSTYVISWMTGRYEFPRRYGVYCDSAYGDCDWNITIYWWQAGLVLAGLLALFVGGAFANFRRRDLT